MIYVIKTIVGREELVLEAIANKAQKEQLRIYALLHPQELKGYIFVEGELEDIQEAIKEIPNTRGVLKREVSIKEIENFLKPKEVEIEINPGDIVEVVGGPFKGTKGKVIRLDKIKREITIEPLEVAVPIPITIRAEIVKILERKS